MNDEDRAYLKAMEDRLGTLIGDTENRLMERINNAQENLIERMRINETATAGLTAGVAALTEVARSTNTTLAVITTMLGTIATGQADLGRRMTDLEKH